MELVQFLLKFLASLLFVLKLLLQASYDYFTTCRHLLGDGRGLVLSNSDHGVIDFNLTNLILLLIGLI